MVSYEGHSKSGLILLGLLIGLFLILTISIGTRGKSEKVKWKYFKTTRKSQNVSTANFDEFDNQPQTLHSAIEQGWKKVSNDCTENAK